MAGFKILKARSLPDKSIESGVGDFESETDEFEEAEEFEFEFEFEFVEELYGEVEVFEALRMSLGVMEEFVVVVV